MVSDISGSGPVRGSHPQGESNQPTNEIYLIIKDLITVYNEQIQSGQFKYAAETYKTLEKYIQQAENEKPSAQNQKVLNELKGILAENKELENLIAEIKAQLANPNISHTGLEAELINAQQALRENTEALVHEGQALT